MPIIHDLYEADAVHCRQAAGAVVRTSKPWVQGEPVEFMYMPGGITTIVAGFRNKAVELTIECNEMTADAVQASYQEWLSRYPKQKPFGCIEHQERDASVLPIGFAWRNGGEVDPGVYMAGEPTARGVEHVNGKIHRSWSPSFITDADYAKATDNGDGVLRFPTGARGSLSNPARITGIAFCVGTLTNKPAFKNINPVKARQADAVKAGAPVGNKNASGPHRLTVQRVGAGGHIVHKFSVVLPSKEEAERIRNIAYSGGEHSTTIEPHTEALKTSEAESNPNVISAEAGSAFDFCKLAQLPAAAQLAHWGADTVTNAHKALGELYTTLSGLADNFAEAYAGKTGDRAPEPDASTLLDEGAAVVAEARAGLDSENDTELLNLLDEMAAAYDKARYLLKAKDGEPDDAVKATWSDAARKASAEARKNYAILEKIAMQRTQEARNASDKAKHSGIGEDHQTAADKHEEADLAHTDAAKGAREAGNHGAYTRHHDYAEWHFASANEHKTSGPNNHYAKATDATTPTSVLSRLATRSEAVTAALKNARSRAFGLPVVTATHVKTYTRTTKTGKVATVAEHEDKRVAKLGDKVKAPWSKRATVIRDPSEANHPDRKQIDWHRGRAKEFQKQHKDPNLSPQERQAVKESYTAHDASAEAYRSGDASVHKQARNIHENAANQHAKLGHEHEAFLHESAAEGHNKQYHHLAGNADKEKLAKIHEHMEKFRQSKLEEMRSEATEEGHTSFSDHFHQGSYSHAQHLGDEAHEQAIKHGLMKKGDEPGMDSLAQQVYEEHADKLADELKDTYAGNTPSAPTSIEDTTHDNWQERDRTHFHLMDKEGNTLHELWDEDARQAVEDGFIDPKNLHQSHYEYAKHLGVISTDAKQGAEVKAGAPMGNRNAAGKRKSSLAAYKLGDKAIYNRSPKMHARAAIAHLNAAMDHWADDDTSPEGIKHSAHASRHMREAGYNADEVKQSESQDAREVARKIAKKYGLDAAMGAEPRMTAETILARVGQRVAHPA